MATEDRLSQADLNSILEGTLVREDVLDRVIDVSEHDKPFQSMAGSSSVKNKRYSWTMDRLSDSELVADDVPAVDGVDVDQQDALLGIRQSNEVQTNFKSVQISTLAEASDSIGGVGKMAEQVRKRGREINRNIEAQVMANTGAQVDNGVLVPGITAGLEAWLDGKILVPQVVTETTPPAEAYTQTLARQDLSTGGITAGGWEDRDFTSNAGGVAAWVYTAVTAGGAMTEVAFDNMIKALFKNTGDNVTRTALNTVDMHSNVSAFYFDPTARVATLTGETNQKGPAQAMTAVNSILTDYGIVKLRANALQKPSALDAETTSGGIQNSFFCLDFRYLEMVTMTGFRVEPLAKTGFSEKRLLSKTWGLRVLSSEAQGIIQGIDVLLPMAAT